MESVFFRYDIWEHGDKVIVYESTNDNLDTGYPSEYASWTTRFKNTEDALKHTGKSRTGIFGSEVTVTLNGNKI